MPRNRVQVDIEGKETVSKAASGAGKSLSQLKKETEGFKKSAEGMVAPLKNMRAGLLAVTGVVAGVGIAFKQAMDVAKIGAQAQQVEHALDNMAARVGTSADQIVAELKKASMGTIAELDIMTSASKAALFDLPLDKLDDLMQIARASAMATGESVQFMFDSIVTGIARGSPMILDNLGLTIKIGDATEAYAQKLGKTAAELTTTERKQATLNAVLESGGDIADRVGVSLDEMTDAERFAAMESAVKDLKVAFGEALLPIVITVTGWVNQLFDRINEWSKQRKVTKLLDERAIGRDLDTIAEQLRIVSDEVESIQFELTMPGLSRERQHELAISLLLLKDYLRELAKAYAVLEKGATGIKSVPGAPTGGGTKAAEDALKAQKKIWEDILGVIEDNRGEVLKLVDQIRLFNTLSDDFLGPQGLKDRADAIELIREKIAELVDEMEFEEWQKWFDGMAKQAQWTGAPGTFMQPESVFQAPAGGLDINTLFSSELVDLADATGGLIDGFGDVSAGFATGAGLMDSFLTALIDAAAQVEALNALLNPFQTIFTQMFAILRPVINEVLSPLVGWLTIIGRTLGQVLIPVFNALAPVIELVAGWFVAFYNMALPIMNLLLWAFDKVRIMAVAILTPFEAIITVIQWFVDTIRTAVHNLVEFIEHPLNLAGQRDTWTYPDLRDRLSESMTKWAENLKPQYVPLQPISEEALTAAGAETLAGMGAEMPSYSSQTTVQRVPDFYFRQYFEGPVVGEGGMRQIGEYVVGAIGEYLGTGVRVEWLEAG